MYIFNADTYCDACMAKWMDENAEFAPEDQDDEYSYDSDEWPKKVPDGEKTDCPQHCGDCHIPLSYMLTSYGGDYVFEAIEEKIKEMEGMSPEERQKPVYIDNDNPNYYYQNAPTYGVVADWVEEVQGYYLTVEQQDLIDRFWELVGEGVTE